MAPRAAKDGEEIPARPRLAEPLVGDVVGGDVEGGLYRDLERVLDEPLLLHVGAQRGREGELTQLADARLDERELLGDEVAVDHGRPSR